MDVGCISFCREMTDFGEAAARMAAAVSARGWENKWTQQVIREPYRRAEGGEVMLINCSS